MFNIWNFRGGTFNYWHKFLHCSVNQFYQFTWCDTDYEQTKTNFPCSKQSLLYYLGS